MAEKKMGKYLELFRCPRNQHIFTEQEWDVFGKVFDDDGNRERLCPYCNCEEMECVTLGFILKENPDG